MAATSTATADSSLFSAPTQMSFLVMPQRSPHSSMHSISQISLQEPPGYLNSVLYSSFSQKETNHVYYCDLGHVFRGYICKHSPSLLQISILAAIIRNAHFCSWTQALVLAVVEWVQGGSLLSSQITFNVFKGSIPEFVAAEKDAL